jgi:hypothetical protein
MQRQEWFGEPNISMKEPACGGTVVKKKNVWVPSAEKYFLTRKRTRNQRYQKIKLLFL